MVVFYQESLNKYGRSVVSAHEVRKWFSTNKYLVLE